MHSILESKGLYSINYTLYFEYISKSRNRGHAFVSVSYYISLSLDLDIYNFNFLFVLKFLKPLSTMFMIIRNIKSPITE